MAADKDKKKETANLENPLLFEAVMESIQNAKKYNHPVSKVALLVHFSEI